MLGYLLRRLKEDGDYKSMEQVAAQGAKLYPCEGWELWQIESLNALGRRKEAEEVYRKTVAYDRRISVPKAAGAVSGDGNQNMPAGGDKCRDLQMSFGTGTKAGGLCLYASWFLRLFSHAETGDCQRGEQFQPYSVHHSGWYGSSCDRPGVL